MQQEKPTSINKKFDLIIITIHDFKKNLMPLVDHKNKLGIKTKIVDIEEIYEGHYFRKKGIDKAEKIKYFIKNSIENWNTKYIMLVGDINKIPIRKIHVWDGTFITDLYYSNIYNKDGSFSNWDTNKNGFFGEYHHKGKTDLIDLNPDIGVGRLACKNGFEVINVVRKIINYEKQTYGKDWFKRIILCGGNIAGINTKYEKYWSWVGKGCSEGEYHNELIKNEMEGFKPIEFRQSKNNINRISIIKELNKGSGFVNFSGHASEFKWFLKEKDNKMKTGYAINDIFLTFNRYKLPIIFFDGCLLGRLDYKIKNFSVSPLAWKIISYRFGGAIACIASARPEYTGIMEGGGCMLGLHFFKTYIRKEKAKEKAILSEIYIEAQKKYLKDFGDRIILHEFNLLGDPSLRIGGYPDNNEPKERRDNHN